MAWQLGMHVRAWIVRAVLRLMWRRSSIVLSVQESPTVVGDCVAFDVAIHGALTCTIRNAVHCSTWALRLTDLLACGRFAKNALVAHQQKAATDLCG
jgi:hypothetical protein